MSPFSHCFLLCGTATTSASIPVGSPSSPPPCSSLAELSTIRVIVYVYYSRLYTDIEVVTSYSRRHSDHQLSRPICRVAYMTEWSCCVAARHDSECEPPVASLRFPRTASRFLCAYVRCARAPLPETCLLAPSVKTRKCAISALRAVGYRVSRFVHWDMSASDTIFCLFCYDHLQWLWFRLLYESVCGLCSFFWARLGVTDRHTRLFCTYRYIL